MILLESFTNLLLVAVIASAVAAIGLFVVFIWYGRRTAFYRDSKGSLGSVERSLVMVIYVMIAAVASFFSFYLFMLLFSLVGSILRI